MSTQNTGAPARNNKGQPSGTSSFLVVANEAGLQKYVRKVTLETGFADAAQSGEDRINKVQTLKLQHRRTSPQHQKFSSRTTRTFNKAATSDTRQRKQDVESKR